MDESFEAITSEVEQALASTHEEAAAVVRAFDLFVAEPLAKKFREITPYDIAKRNPFVYAALGNTKVDQWVTSVLRDMLSSSAEGLVGNWMEEVARIMCGGTKPGSGVDLQREVGDGLVELYAIQTTTNTKNAGGRRSDIRSMQAAAGALRAQRRHVDLYVGYMFRRKRTTKKDGIVHLASHEFWQRVTGKGDFLPRLLEASAILSARSLSRALTAAEPMVKEAAAIYGDAPGGIDWAKALSASKSKTKR